MFAVAGKWWVEAMADVAPYRAVFFTFGSYEGKMRMLHNAMRASFERNETIWTEWKELRKACNDLASLRNEIAHLIPKPKYGRDPQARAIVRLHPPFWKPSEGNEFEDRGYSWDELTQALHPFWGHDPSLNIPANVPQRLTFRVHQFGLGLKPPFPKSQ